MTDEHFWSKINSVATKCNVTPGVVNDVLHEIPVAASVNVGEIIDELIEAKLLLMLSVTP